ncbi:hypothetical protein SAMN04488121_102529 [Chitinophaga filiformis]|uniref:Lipocalin-like domain-containing protein n=2 Tax=Chitinophaga filiformis TaxID=104663 RepID=A0A1G7MR33_CHIFI|nr:hypothetical protein SAMN04488121_102529 [Chitinophaga filiformis]
MHTTQFNIEYILYICYMKKAFSLLSLCVVALLALTSSSCEKDETPKPDPVDTIVLSEKGKILTDTIWRYYEYYKNFQTSGSTLVWKTNRSANTLDLHLNKVKFNKDGSYWEITEKGDSLKGTWHFTNNETQIVVNSTSTFTSDIRVLTANQFEWEVVNGTTYGVMMKRFPESDKTQTVAQLLTSKKWKYETYFYNFPLASADLVWRIGKPNNTYTVLDQLTVEYKADGTTVETYKDGSIVRGTWRLNSDATHLTVTPNGGIDFECVIKVLNGTRFEWNRVDQSYYYYGEMIPADATVGGAARR